MIRPGRRADYFAVLAMPGREIRRGWPAFTVSIMLAFPNRALIFTGGSADGEIHK